MNKAQQFRRDLKQLMQDHGIHRISSPVTSASPGVVIHWKQKNGVQAVNLGPVYQRMLGDE